MTHSTLRDQDWSFCCQVNGNIMLSKFFLWNEAVEVTEATEVIEATEAIEAAEVPDGMEITQKAAFDFLRPKRLLRSLRPVMSSCVLRS
jgi:hypothetical protein